jgi:glycosyltransferase involved in cell wall biosynthesis
MKRVALYYPWIYVQSGVERSILETVRRSRHRYTIFTNHYDREQTFRDFTGIPDLVELRRVAVQRSFRQTLKALGTIVGQRLALDGFDALVVHSEGAGDFLTLRNHDRPVICYCHSLQRPIYDPVYRDTLLTTRPRYRVPLACVAPLYRLATRAAWRRYQHVFVNSEETRQQVAAAGLCAPERVETLHPGVALERIRPSWRYEPFFLYAGRIKWTKNIELAVRAFLEFRRAYPRAGEWKLVVAGDVDRNGRAYYDRLRELAAPAATIEFRMKPSDPELDQLYDRCSALLFTSLSEPWGIVPLEAMAFGKPVLAVNRCGPAESVVDGETGFLLEPTPAAFAGRMAYLADRPEELRRMGKRAVARAGLYSWDHFVERLDDYVERHC